MSAKDPSGVHSSFEIVSECQGCGQRQPLHLKIKRRGADEGSGSTVRQPPVQILTELDRGH